MCLEQESKGLFCAFPFIILFLLGLMYMIYLECIHAFLGRCICNHLCIKRDLLHSSIVWPKYSFLTVWLDFPPFIFGWTFPACSNRPLSRLVFFPFWDCIPRGRKIVPIIRCPISPFLGFPISVGVKCGKVCCGRRWAPHSVQNLFPSSLCRRTNFTSHSMCLSMIFLVQKIEAVFLCL